MSSPDGNGRINVSEDRLRAVIAEFELRLRVYLDDKLMRKVDLIQLTDARKDIIDLRTDLDSQRSDLDSLKQWRSYVLGAVALAVFLAGAAVTFAAVYAT